MFSEAHAVLDEVRSALPDSPALETLRYHLERGRTFRSSGEKENAQREFNEALAMADGVGNDFHTIDTMHMIAIMAPPDEGIEWNLRAIQKAESSAQERAKNWLGSLYNNLGWAYFDKGDYEKALETFEKGLAWQQSKGREKEALIAKWCIARTMRSQGSVQDALQIQMELLADNVTPNEYNYDEIIECLKTLARNAEAEEYIAKKGKLFKTVD
jgi:tetratricopeptide (TPR) repeat protein